jgi:hypothetical protein
MDKITKKVQAAELVNKMLKDSSIEIQLFDNEQENEIIFLEPNKPDEIDYYCYLNWIDTVNGTEGHSRISKYEAINLIYKHRKFINKSGRLNNL